jgi:hypothetical protein
MTAFWSEEWRDLETNERLHPPLSMDFLRASAVVLDERGSLPETVALPASWGWVERATCDGAWKLEDTSTQAWHA